MARDTAAPDPTKRSSKIMSGWACSSESKEKSRKEGLRGSWEVKSCGEEEEEEEENVGVPPTTLR